MKQAITVAKASKTQRKASGNTAGETNSANIGEATRLTNNSLESSSEITTIKSDDLTIEALIPTLKESLLFQKSSILNKTHEFKKLQSENVQLSDEAEVASNDLSQNLSIHLHERDLNALVQIEKALGKINAGTYGECECCSDLINSKRLQARPLATLCIACMEDLEEQKKRIQQ